MVVLEPWWFTEVLLTLLSSIIRAACEDMDIGEYIEIGVVVHGRMGMR